MAIYALGEREPQLPEDDEYWVADNAVVVGDVRLAAEVGVWFGAVLRGDNEPLIVGARSNIQDNAILHTDIGSPVVVGRGVTVGHMAVLHGCEIGDNSLIGIGATVLNGARIGRNCLVGAHALVTEGKEFPDNSLIVGAPARAIRTLDEKAIAGLTESADGYVENWRRFKAQFRPLN